MLDARRQRQRSIAAATAARGNPKGAGAQAHRRPSALVRCSAPWPPIERSDKLRCFVKLPTGHGVRFQHCTPRHLWPCGLEGAHTGGRAAHRNIQSPLYA